jgi:hypothetical protein
MARLDRLGEAIQYALSRPGNPNEANAKPTRCLDQSLDNLNG